MSGASREMTLFEVANKFGTSHAAARELREVVAALEWARDFCNAQPTSAFGAVRWDETPVHKALRSIQEQNTTDKVSSRAITSSSNSESGHESDSGAGGSTGAEPVPPASASKAYAEAEQRHLNQGGISTESFRAGWDAGQKEMEKEFDEHDCDVEVAMRSGSTTQTVDQKTQALRDIMSMAGQYHLEPREGAVSTLMFIEGLAREALKAPTEGKDLCEHGVYWVTCLKRHDLKSPAVTEPEGRVYSDEDDVYAAWGKFRRAIRQVLYENGIKSNPGWSDDNVVDGIRQLAARTRPVSAKGDDNAS
jgi:hypothetical protein